MYQTTFRAPAFCYYGYDGGYCPLDGAGEGQPAIDVNVPLIIIENSFVESSHSDSDGYQFVRASPGIRARSSVVVSVNSELHGGNAGWHFLPNGYGCGPGARQVYQVPGGAAVECMELHRSGSKIFGGRGARWTGNAPGVCYFSPDGPEVVLTAPAPRLGLHR